MIAVTSQSVTELDGMLLSSAHLIMDYADGENNIKKLNRKIRFHYVKTDKKNGPYVKEDFMTLKLHKIIEMPRSRAIINKLNRENLFLHPNDTKIPLTYICTFALFKYDKSVSLPIEHSLEIG